MQLRGLTGILLLLLLHFYAGTAGTGLLLQIFPLHLLQLCCQTHDLLHVVIPAHNSSLERVFPHDRTVLCLSTEAPVCTRLHTSPSHPQHLYRAGREETEMKCIPNCSWTSWGPVISAGFRKVCAGTWGWKGQLGHWAATATGCLITSREDSEELYCLCKNKLCLLTVCFDNWVFQNCKAVCSHYIWKDWSVHEKN